MSRANPPNPQGSRKISFNVSEQYDIQDVVGEGAYGVVWYDLISLFLLSIYMLIIIILVRQYTNHRARRLPSKR